MSEFRVDPEIQELCDSFGNWFQEGCKNQAGNAAKMTRELYPYTSIFSPIRVNRLTIKNRVVMAPMGNLMMAEEHGRPNEKMIQYFLARAKGGVGLLTSGLVPISDGIDNTVQEPDKKVMMPRISPARTLMSGWRDLAQGCHAYGSRFFIQLTPGLGRVGPPTCLVQQHKFPVSASFNPNFYIPEVPCMRLTDHSLNKIIKNAGQAAADAKECLIDGVYLHGHEGYLLEQMTNKAFNHRKMGKFADWQRFGIDMVKEIRNRVGPNYPIMYRIDLSLALNETYGESGMDRVNSLKKFKNGRNIAETLDYMENLVKAGVDLFADTATVNFFPTESGVIVCILETPTFETEGLGILGAMYQSVGSWSPETGEAASDVGSREKETSFTLTRYIDSEQRYEEYPVPVQLYRAEGYSTYIPKEGFEKSEGTYGGRPAVRWEYKDNRDVWFSVVPLDTTSFNEAIQWGLSAGGPGDTLMEDKSGGICGQSTDGSLFWAITFHEKDFKGIYAVICHYPVAQTDDLAAYVKLMADEFQAE